MEARISATFLILILVMLNKCMSLLDYREISSKTIKGKESGILEIQLNANMEFSFKKLFLNLTKKLPNETESVEFRLFPIPHAETVPAYPVVRENFAFKALGTMSAGNYRLHINEGEYFVSFDTGKNEEELPFPFSVLDDASMLITFGYEFNETKNQVFPVYIRKCSGLTDKRSVGKWAFPANNKFTCPILRIEKGKTTKIVLNVSEAKFHPWITLTRWIPGIMGLAPFLFGSAVYSRDITVELENPK